MNENGIACGSYEDSSKTLFTPINYPGTDATVINGLNRKGKLVGHYTDNSGNYHGYWARKSPWILVTPALKKNSSAKTEPSVKK